MSWLGGPLPGPDYGITIDDDWEGWGQPSYDDAVKDAFEYDWGTDVGGYGNWSGGGTPASIGTQVGDFLGDYLEGTFGNDGTASPVAPSQPSSRTSSSPVRPGSSGSSFQAGSSGISKINDSVFMIDPGYEKMILEAQLRAQDQLRQAQINAAYAPQQRMAGGGSEGGSDGNGVKSLIKTGIKYGVSQIPVVGDFISNLF